jgi:hypothetical protein
LKPIERLDKAATEAAILRKQISERRKVLANAEKVLAAVPETGAACLAAAKKLHKVLGPAIASSDEALVRCARELLDALDAAGGASREGFVRELRDTARERGMEVEFRDSFFVLSGLRVVPDLAAGTCRINLAEEPVEEGLPLDPLKCLDAVEQHAKRLLGDRGDPGKILKSVYDAYRAVCGQRGIAIGQHVPIVDVIAQVALLQQSEAFRRDPGRARFRDYRRSDFAADLLHLKQKRRLELSGSRLNLQTAVIDTAGKRSRSISVPEDGGRSMIFYQGLAFTPDRGGRE